LTVWSSTVCGETWGGEIPLRGRPLRDGEYSTCNARVTCFIVVIWALVSTVKCGRNVQLLICTATLPSSILHPLEYDPGASTQSTAFGAPTKTQESCAGLTGNARSPETEEPATCPIVANTILGSIHGSTDPAKGTEKPCRIPFDPIRDLSPS